MPELQKGSLNYCPVVGCFQLLFDAKFMVGLGTVLGSPCPTWGSGKVHLQGLCG